MATKRVEQPCPGPSALSKLIEASSASGNPFSATTLQIMHNLQHQHLWTSLQIHDISTPSDTETSTKSPITSLPDNTAPTLISGIPPHRVYTHPDEQLYMLEQGLRDDDLKPERIFVIPTAQGQSWSLRRMAAVFDALAEVQPDETSTGEKDTGKAEQLAKYYERRKKAHETKEWGGKRVLLAMVDKGMGGEGTVVYYVVQEGEVKPRQN
ncbi:hypothetical protein PENDEC_c008G02604 [Penicillium decumbens]|uniref:tRNA-splicing endonuclease subunit Sen15 domain-containing protein n=1 Tax=Penicillium decumbens TaxID=69771 RepID=A0A1V6PDE3_PENDC|nr:hypothetical protein PENDEC_c008G02604 [Penicillium decumbens]